MRSGAYLRSMKGVFLAALVTLGLLLLPVMATWGSKGRAPSSPAEWTDALENRKTRQLPRVTAVERPADLSPFGAAFEPDWRERALGSRKNLVETIGPHCH